MCRSASGKLPVTRFNRAIVREPAQSVTSGLRAADGGSPTYAGIRAEHDAYVAALSAAGVAITALPPLEEFPDSIFVEDPALVFPEAAILLRSGASSRAGEVEAIAPILREMFDTVLDLSTPGSADGGDVLVTPRSVMIGLSGRTDRLGAEALMSCLARFGRKAEVVETPEGVLHFKTACSLLDDETVLATQSLARSGVFDGLRQLVTPDGEEAAAAVLRVNDVVMVGSKFPRTIEMLDSLGYTVVPLGVSQIGKIDACLSCMSLRWHHPAAETLSG